jgi:hypothetical protein
LKEKTQKEKACVEVTHEIGMEMLQAKQEKNLQEQVQEQGEKQQQQLNYTNSELMIDKSSLYKILDDNNSIVENFEKNFGDTYDGRNRLSSVFLMFKKTRKQNRWAGYQI